MIFYFTGTGNSGYLAQRLAEETKDKAVSISDLMNNKKDLEFTLDKDEKVGFVFPVYAWGPPKMVEDFIMRVKFTNFNKLYTYAVASCGADIGNTMKIISKDLNSKNLELNSGFSVIMPNNYIIMGDVDSEKKVKEKLEKAEDKIKEISAVVNNKQKGIFKVKKGLLGPILTPIVHPMFIKNAIDTTKFTVEDTCIGCGKCEKVCTSSTIKLVDNKPVWGSECNQCLACINNCPVRAIQYGKSTYKKGRYVNPYFKTSEN